MGGTWTIQNKVIPDIYINKRTVAAIPLAAGIRGIATIPLALDWGAEGELIEVFAADFLSGASLPLIGFSAVDTGKAKLLRPILGECYLCKVFRLNSGGVKATATIGTLTITARHSGVLGNAIQIVISAVGSLRAVETYLNGERVDTQTVANIGELESNPYVIFSGTGSLTIDAGTSLTSGTNGTTVEATAYTAYKNLLQHTSWTVAAIPTSNTAIKKDMADFAEAMREEEGKPVQVCISDYTVADYEGVITNYNSATIDGTLFTNEEATSIICGLSAGAPITQSNTGRVIRGATNATLPLSRSDLEKKLEEGYIVFGTNQDGSVKVVQDINSLHTFTVEKNRNFRKNRIIRTLDEIAATLTAKWENGYLGRVNNDSNGRAIFLADVVSYLKSLNGLAIQNFNENEDAIIAPGIELDSVLLTLNIQPLDSMEKLYVTINIIT